MGRELEKWSWVSKSGRGKESSGRAGVEVEGVRIVKMGACVLDGSGKSKDNSGCGGLRVGGVRMVAGVVRWKWEV